MRKLLYKSGTCIGLALLSPAALADTQEAVFTQVQIYALYLFLIFVIIVALGVYFWKLRDKRRTPLSRIFEKGEAVHSVGPDTPVTECVLDDRRQDRRPDRNGRRTADRDLHRAGCAEQSTG